MKKSILTAASALTIAFCCGTASGQTGDVIIMRKSLSATAQGSPGAPTPTPPSGTPTPSPTPAPARGGWMVGEWAFGDASACTATATQTRKVSCQVAGTTVDASRCDGAPPETQRTAPNYQGCAFSWSEGAWSPYSSTCSTRATRTRDVSCLRSDGTAAPESSCDPAARPAASEVLPVYEGCSFGWKTGEFLDPGSACTAAETQTRTVTCQRDLDGSVAPDASCAPQPRPESTTVVEDLSSCGYEAADWSPYVSSSTCSATATKTRTAQCRRSDGTKVADVECTGRGIELSETVTEENYSSCTYDWSAQPWSEPSTACGQAQFSRAVTCRSEPDGRLVADAQCDVSGKPSATKTEEVTSGCSFSWKPGTWSTVVPACGASVQTRQVVCERSDGTQMADGQCAAAGTRPADQQAATDYSTCTYGWSTEGWSEWSSTCGSASRSRAVTCRSSDGRTVADVQCGTTKPDAVQNDYLTTGCGYVWHNGAWGEPERGCGASRQWRAVWCTRSDGQVVDSGCGEDRPSDNRDATDYSACSYSWSVGAWSAPSTTCGASTRTRTVSCQRSDGTEVADDRCSDTRPESTQSEYQVSGCGHSVGNYSPWTYASSCSSSTHAERRGQCIRADGQVVADAECQGRGIGVTDETYSPNYAGCSYEYTTSEWTDWSSTCSSDAFRRRTVYCERSDGMKTNTDYANCVAAGRTYPGYEEHSAIYSSCTYTPTYGAWEACEFLGTRRRAITCTRSDGTKVDGTLCGAQTAEYQYGTCELDGEARGTKTEAASGEEILASPKGEYRLVMQTDGDLAILNRAGAITWHSGITSPGATWNFQGDGNMVVYTANVDKSYITAVWHTDTWSNINAYYVLDDVGQLTVYNDRRSPNVLFRTQGGTSVYVNPNRR